MTRKLILGPPGTGKTTTLVRLVKEELKKVAPEKIAFISYTNAAIASMREKIDTQHSALPYFRTLHSLCYSIIGISNDMVLGNAHQTKFEKVMGYQGVKISLSFDDGSILNKKNQPLNIHHLAKNKCQTIEQIVYDNIVDVSTHLVHSISNEYGRFKNYYGLFDYTDMLEEALNKTPLDIHTVFIDEAQDLTPLQWKVVDHLFSKAKKIIIAGDDDQAIYEWSGATVDRLFSMDFTEKEILNKSYRLSSGVLDYAKTITNQIDKRFNKKIIPGNNEGSVNKLISIDHILDEIISTVKQDKTWYFLARNVYMLDVFSNLFYAIGIPFTKRGIASISNKFLNAFTAWKKGYQGGFLSDSDKKLLATYQSKYDVDLPWYDTFDKVDREKIVYIRKILANKLRIMGNIPINVDTIHSTKGKEADYVVLLPDISTTTRKMFNRFPDREHRVWYVGSTRSKSDLYIMENSSPFYYKIV